MTKTELITQLSQKVDQLYQQVGAKKDQRLTYKLEAHLFSEHYQTYAFYFNEIKQTLTQLDKIDEQDLELCRFLVEKFLSQCTAISDSLLLKKNQQTTTFTPQNKQDIHRLPPRERLAKYYEALNALNQKITDYQDQQLKCTDPNQQYQLAQRIAFNQLRRDKCLNAIETLEEYLVFKHKRKQRT